MFPKLLTAAPLFLAFSAQAAFAQDCPTSATAGRMAKQSVDTVIERGATASGAERGSMTVRARAHTILAWQLLGLDGLRQNKGGLTLLASCMGAGGCGFEKTDTGPIYGFINANTVPAVLAAPPPASAVAWAREKLGCAAGSAPAQTEPLTQAASSQPPASDLPRRPVPKLVPEGTASADMATLQSSIEIIDERCHTGATTAIRMENCRQLAKAFDTGIAGYAYSPGSGEYYFRRGCENGWAMGCFNYGSIRRDYAKTDAEMQEALEYVGKACDLGSEMGCGNYKAWTGTERAPAGQAAPQARE